MTFTWQDAMAETPKATGAGTPTAEIDIDAGWDNVADFLRARHVGTGDRLGDRHGTTG